MASPPVDKCPAETAPVGIIAGSGRLPVILLEALRAEGREGVVISVSAHSDPALEDRSVAFRRLAPGQLRRMIKTFHNAGVCEIVMIGGVDKAHVFQPRRLDTLAIKVLARHLRRGDRTLLTAIAETFEAHGLRVLDQRTYLRALLAPPGLLTRKRPDRTTRHDMALGIQLARQMAALDIGQTVVIKEGVVVAVEAVEGTDEAIRRGASLVGEGIVVAKAAHPQHDFRFDVPTVGPQTLELLREVRARALAVEAGRVFLIDGEQMLDIANEANIVIMAFAGETS